MSVLADTVAVQEVVPFLHVRDIAKSLSFYRDGLHFQVRHLWPDPDAIRWCWLTLGTASIMLQTARPEAETTNDGKISLCFMCTDALGIYHRAISDGLDPSEPFVGNGLWVTTLIDPDGNRLDFESPTDTKEGTSFSELNA